MGFVKICKDDFEFRNESYALEKLDGTGVAPKLLRKDEHKREIVMEKVTIPQLAPFSVVAKGDAEILAYAVAERDARLILDKMGVAFHDWKADNLFYDIKSHKLIIIDFGGDQSETKPGINADNIKREFEFINDPNYTSNLSYKRFQQIFMSY